MPSQPQQQGVAWQDVLALGNQGIATLKSALKVGPTFLADGENIEIDDANISNRLGSLEVYKDPNNVPTTAITQLFTAKDSHGVEYLLRYWNGNMELWVNNTTWLPINGGLTFNATKLSSKFGKANWNNGYGAAWNEGADVLYLGNGLDQQVKWVIAETTLSANLTNGSTLVQVVSTIQFPPIYDAWHTAVTSQPILINGTVVNYKAIVNSAINVIGNPSNGDVITLVINGTTMTINLVSVIGVTAGNVLIGATPAITQANVLNLLQHPGTTNANQVALSAGNQTLVGYLTWLSSGTSIYSYQSNTLFSTISGGFSGSVGNNFQAFPGVFVLTAGWGGSTVTSGATVVMPLQKVNDVSSGSAVPVAGGTMMLVVNQQLISAGMSGQETFLVGTGILVNGGGQPHADPEMYTGTVGGIGSGFLQEFADGDGPITAIYDSLQNILVHKRNSIRKFYFEQNTSLNAVLPVIAPVYTGDSSGSVSNFQTITINLQNYYPTATEGISVMTPSYSYGTVFYTPSILSVPIQNLVAKGSDINFLIGEGTYYNNKGLWSVGENGSEIPNLVLYYDIIAQGWGKIRGWYPNSWTTYGGGLIFADRGSFGIRQAFSANFDDNDKPYTSYALTSQFSFNEVAKTKVNPAVYVQGTINKGGVLYIDVYYNQQNASGVWKKTYKISSTNKTILFPSDKLFGSNQFGQLPFIGALGDAGNTLGFYKLYLRNNEQYEWNTIQVKAYSVDAGTQWSLQALSFCPSTTEAINTELNLYPV